MANLEASGCIAKKKEELSSVIVKYKEEDGSISEVCECPRKRVAKNEARDIAPTREEEDIVTS